MQGAGHLGFLACSKVRVDYALGRRLVQLLGGKTELFAQFLDRPIHRGREALELGLDFLLDRAVT